MIAMQQPSGEMVSWAPSKEPSLITVRELRRPAISSRKNQRATKNVRSFHKATTLIPSKLSATLSTAEDVVLPHGKFEAEKLKPTSGCPVMREFQQAQDHHPVLASTGCTRNFCQAGRVVHTDEPRIGENRALEVVEKEAEGFLHELHQEHFFATEENYRCRLASVLAEIRADAREGVIREGKRHGRIGGTWHQTSAELEFGIRRAWRNARKCIMRSHCEELKLCDLRHITSSADMARELIQHMRSAFNGGNVMPT
ncbi:MAG: hypothetical protein Q9218_007197, partial [Villophora microphyllina]